MIYGIEMIRLGLAMMSSYPSIYPNHPTYITLPFDFMADMAALNIKGYM